MAKLVLPAPEEPNTNQRRGGSAVECPAGSVADIAFVDEPAAGKLDATS